MKKLFQILFISIFFVNLTTPSEAIVGKIKAVKGIFVAFKTNAPLLFKKTPLLKIGAADTGLMAVDNVAKEALSINKLNKDLISKIKKSQEEEIINLVKNDDSYSLTKFENIEDVNLENDKLEWWNYLHVLNPNRFRALTKDLKPDNFIYACETTENHVYFFSLLPKKNLALISSSQEMIGSQRLRVESASAKGTVLTGIIKDNKRDYYFLLPNYKFYYGNHDINQEFDVIPNGECYNTEINIDTNKIEYIQFEFKPSNNQKSFIEKNLKFYAYICYLFAAFSIFGLIWDEYIKKSEERAYKFAYFTFSTRMISHTLFNLFGVGAGLIILSSVTFVMWLQIITLLIFVWYLYGIYNTTKHTIKSLKVQKFSLIFNIDIIITIFIFLAGLIILFLN